MYNPELIELETLRNQLNDHLLLIKEQNYRNPEMRKIQSRKIIALIIFARLQSIQERIEEIEFQEAFRELELIHNNQ